MPDQNIQIQRLIEHNDELENYFRNTIIPQLFIDGTLKLQKFTPPAMKQFSLKSSDVGKSIHEIKDNFRFPTIEDDIQQVIKSNEILEKEIQTTDFALVSDEYYSLCKIKRQQDRWSNHHFC